MPKDKIQYLEGIRGLMAINVVINHFVVFYLPQMYFKNYANRIGGQFALFAKTPLSILVNGNIAVCFFLVLTGYLVARSVFLSDKEITPEIINNKTAKRYIRFLPMIVIATMFTYLTMLLGLQKHHDIAEYVINTEFLDSCCNFKPSLVKVMTHSFWMTFIDYNAYLKQMWMIRYEFFGYIGALILSGIIKKSKSRRLIYVFLTIVLVYYHSEFFAAVLFGIALADFLHNSYETWFMKYYSKLINNPFFLAVAGIFGIYCACCPMYYATIYSYFEKQNFIQPELLRIIGISICLYILARIPKIQFLFEIKPLLWLGQLSFSIYAIHIPVYLTCQAWLFKLFYNTNNYYSAAVLSFVITVPVIIIMSFLVDRLYQLISKRIIKFWDRV